MTKTERKNDSIIKIKRIFCLSTLLVLLFANFEKQKQILKALPNCVYLDFFFCFSEKGEAIKICFFCKIKINEQRSRKKKIERDNYNKDLPKSHKKK